LTNTSSSVGTTTSSSPSVATTITVGNNPTSIAYDSGKGEIFVIDGDSGSVAIISDSTNEVLSQGSFGLSAFNLDRRA
jgi:DNA-binding beta-propeller fold protein YncE